MISKFFTSPEPLEQRIAPAGLITASYAAGLLTINGADGADHDVEIVKTGLNTFRVAGNATDINSVGHASQDFHGILTGVLIEGGAGADTFALTNLAPLKTLRFHGNAGVDSLSTANLVTTVGATVDISLGSETGSVNLFGSQTTIHGGLNIDLGGGGIAGFRSAVTTVDGAVAIHGGPGSDSVAITGLTTLFKNKFDFTGSDGNDTYLNTGKSFTVQGAVTMDGGAGTNQFVFAADTNTFGKAVVPGSVDIKLGTGAGSVSFLGKTTNMLADLKLDLGTTGGTASLNSAVTTIRDSVQVTGGAGNDVLEFQGRTSIGKTLSFTGNDGDDSLTAAGGLFSVKGATTMVGGAGASSFDLHPVSLALAALSVTGGVENDTVNITADGTISGNTNLELGLDGTGPSSVVLQSKAGIANGLKLGGTLTIDMIGATVDALKIANIQVAKAIVAQTGEGVSTVDIYNLKALTDFKLQTGAGADVVNIDNITSRDFYVDTQVGADVLHLERNAAYTGISKISGKATILTGIGADEIRIGNGSDYVNQSVSFMGALLVDAGDGANGINDVFGSNFFEFIPKILTTGGTLTQTAAV